MTSLRSALVLEDSAHMRLLLGEVLRAAFPFERVLPVGCVDEAKTALAGRERFDIALVDIGLRDGSGLDFVRTLRLDREHHQRKLPILIISGQTQRAAIEAARDAGVNGFVAKPISVGALTAKIGQVLAAPADFVDAVDYFGPDRRRADESDYAGRERRVSARWELD